MNEKINELKDEIIKYFKKHLNIQINTDKVEIKDNLYYCISGFIKNENHIVIILTEKIDEKILKNIEKYKIDFIKNNEINEGRIKIFLIIFQDELNYETIKQLHLKNFYLFFDTVIPRLSLSVIDYFNLLDNPIPDFVTVISEYDEMMLKYKDHIELEAGNKLFYYKWLNEVKPIFSEEESNKIYWEKNIIDANLKPEIDLKPSKESKEKKTFAPRNTYYSKETQSTIIYPDIDKLKTENGIEDYVLYRFQTTRSTLLKYRYFELLIYWKSNRLNRPQCFKDLITIIKEIIEGIKNNLLSFNYPYLILVTYYHRGIEVISKYFNLFSDEEKKLYFDYYFQNIEFFRANKEYRWILDLIEILTIYKPLIPLIYEKKDYIYTLLNEMLVFFDSNINLKPATIDIITEINKILKEEHIDTIKEKANSYFIEAKTRADKEDFLSAIHFINISRNIYLSNEGKYKTEIDSINLLAKEWHKKQKGQMKGINIEFEEGEKLKKVFDDYIDKLSKMVNKSAIEVFFTDSSLIMSEKAFNDALKTAETGVFLSLAHTMLLDENRTVFNPSDEDENKLLQYWLWYSRLIQIYLPSINYIFYHCLDKQIFTIENIIDYIKNEEFIEENDKQIIIEAFKVYNQGFFASSISLITPLIEKFFRDISAINGDDIKYSNIHSYHNVKLDDMIQEAEKLIGFPKNMVLLGRFLFTIERGGYYLRHKIAHCLAKYEEINNKGLNEIILWYVSYCFISLNVVLKKSKNEEGK